MEYVVIYIFLLVLCFIPTTSNWQKKNVLTLGILVLIFFAGLRYQVGTDWDSYYSFYVYGVDDVEIGFAFLNNLFRGAEIPYAFFLLFINALSLFLLRKSLLVFSSLPILGLLFYYSDLYLYFNFSGVRQAIAISIVLFSLTFILNKRRQPYKFFFFLFLAMCFHISSIVFLLAYFIPQRRPTKREIIIFVLGLVVIYFGMNLFSSLFLSLLDSKAEFYLEVQDSAYDIQTLFYIGILRRLIPILLVFFTRSKDFFDDRLAMYFLNLYCIGFGVFMLFYMLSPDLGVRLSVYFTVVEIFLLGNLVYFTERSYKRIVVIGIILLVSYYKLSTYFVYEMYDYKWILGQI